MKRTPDEFEEIMYDSNFFDECLILFMHALNEDVPHFRYDEDLEAYITYTDECKVNDDKYYCKMSIDPIDGEDFKSLVSIGTFNENKKWKNKHTIGEVQYKNGNWEVVRI